jgi:hypothetical protein
MKKKIKKWQETNKHLQMTYSYPRPNAQFQDEDEITDDFPENYQFTAEHFEKDYRDNLEGDEVELSQDQVPDEFSRELIDSFSGVEGGTISLEPIERAATEWSIVSPILRDYLLCPVTYILFGQDYHVDFVYQGHGSDAEKPTKILWLRITSSSVDARDGRIIPYVYHRSVRHFLQAPPKWILSYDTAERCLI